MGGAVSGWVALVLHMVLVAVAAPLLDGWVRVVGARLRGETPPPVEQGRRDLVRLWRKPSMAPAEASFVFLGAPVVALGSALVAAVVVPGFCLGLATADMSDLLVVAGLLGLSRAAVGVAAFEAAAAAVWQEARGMAAWAPAGAVLLLVALVVMLLSGGTGLDAAAASVRDGGGGMRVAGAMAGFALLVVVSWGESGAGPGQTLFSGRASALLAAAGQVRRVVGLSAVALVGAPFGIAGAGAGVEAGLVGVACWVLKLGVLGAVSVGFGRREWLIVAGLLALIAAVTLGVQGRV